MRLNIKQLVTMIVLSAASALLLAQTDHMSPNEISPYRGERYDGILNTKYFERYPKLKEMVDLESFRLVGSIFGVDKNRVYVQEEILKNADPATFQEINTQSNWNEYYAKDKDHVYKEGKLVPLADPETFEPLWSSSGISHSYGIDKNRVFVDRKVIEGADLHTFVFFDGYARDKDHIYYKEVMMKNSDADSFKLLKMIGANKTSDAFGYAQDENQVYYYPNILEGADPKTFRIIGSEFAADKNTFYIKNRKIEGVDGESAEIVVNTFFTTLFKDKNHFYFIDKNGRSSVLSEIMFEYTDIDPNTFKLIGESSLGSYYGTDHQYVYDLSEKNYAIIEGADPKSFSIIAKGYYLKDDNHVYTIFNSYSMSGKESEGFAKNRVPDYQHQIIKEAEAASFEYLGSGYGMDKNNLYFSFSTGYIILEARGDDEVVYHEKIEEEEGYEYGYIKVGNRCYREGQLKPCDSI